MKGETQHVYSIKDPEPSSKKQDKDFECHSNLEGGELNSPQSDGLPKATFSTKDKEPHSQREAVIRPQQAGKIDFKSLHNRPKLLTNGPWSAVKGTLQSPTGKSRVRDKTRRAGKGERGHQQLYRLTITNSRANPTIGIAYPQQKVTPPKKLEVSKRPASGSYRFNVPSIPEREAELQQEEVSFNRYFQEAPSSLTSTNYTSQAPPTTPPHHSRKDQQVGPPQDRPPHYLEFQVNRADSWPSPEKSFPGANYEVIPTKPCPFPEGSKPSAHCFVPFQYPFQVSEPFPVEATSQDFVGTHHGPFVFHSSSRNWQEDPLTKGSFDSLSQEGRAYALPLQSAPFLHPPTPGAQLPSPLPCFKERGDSPPDVNGAISSSGANDQNSTPFLEGQGIFSTSLHGSMPKAVTKGQSSAKQSIPDPRMPTPSHTLRRSIPQNPPPQVHFPNKVFGGSPTNGMSPASMSLDNDGSAGTEGHSKVAQPWDGGNKMFTTMDQDSALYSTTAAAAAAAAAAGVGNHFPFECQASSEQRPHVQRGARVTWQQIHLTSALPNPNKSEPSKLVSSQKVPFPPGTSEWQGVGKMPKTAHLSNPPDYPGKIRGAGEKITAQRSEPIQLNGDPPGVYPYEGMTEAGSPSCDARTKPLFFGINQPQASPRRASKLSLALSPPGLSATSPGKSPLPSPVPNPTSNSTCSSLSPLSTSPVNHSSEDSQLSVPLASSSYFQPAIHPKENKTFHSPDPSSDLSIPYQAETMKTFHFPVDGPKDENLFKCLQESQFPRVVTDVSKGSLDNFEGEPPPYSSHHFLANSISSASLDQLDVLLTCKQCDQNYSNLTSFLEHRQYCGLHSAFLAEMRDGSRLAEGRKRPPDPLRAPQSGSMLPGSKGPSDPHSFMLDGETKGESKDDPLKGHFFTNSLSLMASDLEIEDAKLDSLITEALNGLEYQSDNPEIDSSFIDVFTDEELSATKGLGTSQSYKTKEGAGPESKPKPEAPDGGQGPPPPTASHCEEGYLTRRRSQSRLSEQPPPEKEQTSKTRERGRGKRVSLYKKELALSDPLGTGGHNKMEKASRGRPRRKFSKTSSTPPSTTRPSSREARKQPRRSSPDSEPNSQDQDGAANTHPGPRSPKRHRFSKKEGKRKKTRNGTWSKELIHKIVQQKNKPHKLQVKNGRIMQFSLVTPKPVPTAKSGQFGEYDYISDSDEDGRGCSLSAPRKRQLESSSINGRPRHNFLRRNRGDKEPGQKVGRKRHENSQEDPSDEAENRKESESLSPGDDQSTNSASQLEKQSQSTDKGNSDKEKESIPEIRGPSDSDHTPPLPMTLPQLSNQEETSPKNYPLLEDFSKKSKRPGSAKALTARTEVLPLSSYVNENGSITSEEKTMQSKEIPTYKPSQTGSHVTAASESKVGETHIDMGPQEVSRSPLPSTHNIEPPFSPFNEDTLKYQTGELINPSQVSNSMDISYGEASMEYLKNHDPSADPKDFALTTDCYDEDPISIMLSRKRHTSYESNTNKTSPRQKDLEDHYDSNLYSKPLVLGSSHEETMYLDEDGASPNTFEPRSAKIPPYTTESESGKVSPPLSFDSSSIFSGLPVAGFDTPLYGSMSPSKVSYIPFACENTSPSKPTELEQQYPSFIHEKDWTLEEVSPVLSDDMGHFHDLSVEKSLVKKFPDEGTVTPSQIPLPGKIGDYNVPFMNNMSEDELEIKRLVTELESELQTSKLDDATPGILESPEHFIALDAPETTKEFSPSPLGQEPEHEKDLFLAQELTNLESTNLLKPKSHSGPEPGEEKETVTGMDGDYGSHQRSWSCAISFDPLTAGITRNAHEDSVAIEPFGSPLTCDQFHLELQEADISKETSCSQKEDESLLSADPSLPNVSKKLELLASVESLTKSNPIRESMSYKNRETNKMTKQDLLQLLPSPTREDMFSEPHKMAQALSEPPKLEAFGNPVIDLKSEMDFQDDRVPVLDTTSSSDARILSTSEENALKKAKETEILKNAVISHPSDEEPILEGNEAALASVSYPPIPICEKAGHENASLFEVLSLAKDPVCGDETAQASQGSPANPLQELQLFVARTVQGNEEEKMSSCLTELLSVSFQLPNTSPSDLKGEGQEDEHMVCGHNNDDAVMESGQATPLSTTVGIQLFPEKDGNPGSLNETESFLAKQSNVGSPEEPNHVTQLQHNPEPGNLQICLDGVSQDTSPSPFSNTSDSPRARLAKREDQHNEELDKDHNIETWTFEKYQPSPLSPVSLEKEELGDAITETQSKSSAWGKEKQLPSPEKSKRTPEKFRERSTVLPTTSLSPKHLLETDYWEKPTISATMAEESSVSPRQHLQTPPLGEESALSIPLQVTASSQECLQSDRAESLLTTGDTQDEKEDYNVLLHNPEKSTPSSLEESISDPGKSLKCSPPQSPGETHTREDVHSVQSVFQDQNISGNGRCFLEKDVLNNQVEPREEEPRSSLAPFDLSLAMSSPLAEDTSRKAPIHDSTISNIPHSGQDDVVRRMPMNCTCIELACPHHMEDQPRPLPDVTSNIHSQEKSKSYPEDPRNSLIFREAVVEKELNSQQEREARNNDEDIYFVAMDPEPTKMPDTNIGDPKDVLLLSATDMSSFNSASPSVDLRKDNLRIDPSNRHRNDLPESSINDMQSHLDCIQEKNELKKKSPPLKNGQWKRSPPESNELQVTCDICCLSFKSKPGLMRHKAVKHRIKNKGPSLPNKTTRSSSAPLEKEPKMSRHHSKKRTRREKACGSLINSSPSPGPPMESEPNTQEHEEVRPGLSGLRVSAPPLTHELLHSDLVNGKAQLQPQSSEPGKSDKSHGRKPSPKKLDRRRKARKHQSKEPASLNSDSEEKLIRGVRKKQVKRFPRKKACIEASNLEENLLEVSPDVNFDRPDSSSSSTIADYPGQSHSALLPLGKDWNHAAQSSLSAKPVHETLKDLDEMGSQILFTEGKLGQKTINDLMKGQRRLESPSTRDQVQVSEEAWGNNFLKPGKEELCSVYNEMDENIPGTNEEEYVMEKRKLEEGPLENHDLPLKQEPLSPAKPDLPLGASDPEKRKTITPNSLPQVFSEDTVKDSEAQDGNMGEQNKESVAKDHAKVDIQHLFDDDATFSLLFPRDDHFSRRKCTRVYGKGPKKPKPVIETSSQMVGSTEMFSIRLPSDLGDTDSFCVTQEDPMSFHDAFTLDMCHGNDTWSLSPGLGTYKPDNETDSDNKMGLNLDEDEMLKYLCPNNRLEAIPNLHISPAVWNDLEVLDHCNEMSFKSPLEAKTEYSLGEASPEPPELEVETYASHIPRNLDSPELHPIDFELLSTKFEMRDMPFFSTCEDCTGQSDPSTLSFKKVSEHIQPNKQKEEEGKRGRSRSDITIKTREKHYKCKVCFQWFLTLGELDFHKLTHNPSPPPTCYMCVQRKFSSREQLKEHLKGKHAKNKVGLWACGMCLKEISDVWMYNEHLREHAAKFARKGQVQKCMTGLPTYLGEDNAVTQFLNTIMNRKPRPPRGKRSANKGSKDLQVQESKGSQDILEGNGKNKPVAQTNTPAHSSFPTTTTAPASSSKVGSPDPGPSGEQPSKVVPMHPQCKDPSRDCHHCGKQFPKPFKLQRHLVVHSLEKIYMCTRCPKFYKETRELRGHLSQEHGVKEKPEIKHTTLYTCELCADVMHVIKKSFICSTCNYTFSKKEQYERHMEKHLAEGNRTFKFRGVMRPGAGARERKERKKKEVSSQDSMPPNKKRKVALPNSLPGPDAEEPSGVVGHEVGENPALGDQSPPILYKRFLEEAHSSPARVSNEENPKDLMGCFSGHMDKMEGYPLELLQLPPPCLSPLSDTPVSDTPEECKESNSMALLCIEEPKDDLPPRSPTPFLETSKMEQDLPIHPIGRSQEVSENRTLHLTPVQSRHTNVQNKLVVDADKETLDYPTSPGHTTTEAPLVRTGKKIPTSHSNKTEAPWPKEPQKAPGSVLSGTTMSQKESSSKPGSSKIPYPAQPFKNRTASPTLNRVTKDSAPQQKTAANHIPKEAASSTSSVEDVPRPTTLKTKPNQNPRSKDSVGSNVKEGGGSQPKPTSTHIKNDTAMISTKPDHKDLGISPDKPSLSVSTKALSKRQKEHRDLGHKGSLGSRENIKGDGKKKKAPEMSRGEGPKDYKKAEWIGNNSSIPSSKRRGTQDNRVSKPRSSGTSSQVKKTMPDSYNQKKIETHHHKRNVKCKKGILGKSFREVVPKGNPSSLHSALKRGRTVQGAKPAETHKYRTVESQNNLLSQLFGQKLTSFKIPLRKDTSE